MSPFAEALTTTCSLSTQGEDGGKPASSPDEHAFSADVTSLAEIFGGTGISEKRLGTEAGGMRKSSVQGFRQALLRPTQSPYLAYILK
jgi:hypothetical protein